MSYLTEWIENKKTYFSGPKQGSHDGRCQIFVLLSHFQTYMYLNNYFNLHVCLSMVLSVRVCVRKLTLVFAVGSQNLSNRRFLVSVRSEKYAFWVTLRRAKAKSRKMHFDIPRGKAELLISILL